MNNDANDTTDETTRVLTGEAVSDGISLGRVFLYQPDMPNIEKAHISSNQSETAHNRWLEARAAVERELNVIIEGVTDQPSSDLMIFDFQKELLFDEEVEAGRFQYS